jgi:membrane-associated protease RseP (regulator of RpoE activity)
MEEDKEQAAEEPKKISFSLTKNIWINILLFVITVFTTLSVGISLSVNYLHTEALVQGSQVPLNLETVMDPQVISLAIIYVVVLLGILLGHEFGHFLTCRYYRIDATLPYFIPAPTLIGTLGAFIKIKSPVTRKKQLFDIGVAGPLTGFILSIPALIYGLSLSKALPPSAAEEQFVIVFGEPLILKILGVFIFKNIPSDYSVFLHPVAFAGWVGILVTSFNLFPVGQLDGGHVSYSLLGEKARHVAGIFLGVFIIMGIFFWIGWFIWALILVFLGWRHPRIVDESIPLSPRRKLLAYLMVVIFILSFITDPIKGYNLFEIMRLFRF